MFRIEIGSRSHLSQIFALSPPFPATVVLVVLLRLYLLILSSQIVYCVQPKICPYQSSFAFKIISRNNSTPSRIELQDCCLATGIEKPRY